MLSQGLQFKSKPTILWMSAFLLVGAGVLIGWFPLLANDWVYYDDPPYILENPLLGESSLLSRIRGALVTAPEGNWIPLTWLVFMMLDEAVGTVPVVFHGVSLTLHLVTAGLVLAVCRGLGLRWVLCVLLALLWALHPHKVESVAWATAMKDVLSGLFGFLAILLLMKGTGRKSSLLAWLAFVLSLMSKQAFVALPVCLFVFDVWKDGGIRLKTVLRRWHWWLASCVAGLMTLVANGGRTAVAEFEQPRGVGEYLFRGLAALGHHVQGSFFPVGLTPEYLDTAATLFKALLGLVFLVGLAGLVFQSWRKRGGEGTVVPPGAVFCFLVFLVLLLPFLGFIPSPMEFTADRLSYAPSFFLWVGMILTLGRLSKRTGQVLAMGGGLLVMVFLGETWRQIPFWKDGRALNERMLQVTASHPTALQNRGVERTLENDLEGALLDFEKVTTLYPLRVSAWSNSVRVLVRLNRLEGAQDRLNEGLKIHPHSEELLQMAERFEGYQLSN